MGDEATIKEIISEVNTDNDCAISLLFALLPVLSGTSGVLEGITYITKSSKVAMDDGLVTSHLQISLYQLPPKWIDQFDSGIHQVTSAGSSF
ncbi:hypothetical protein Ahy_A04g018365 [Arachis hypogaea]|uniref:Uncharacterized protein n=1 Tax=Arachis hypogaea TaxID=3818 RepID=A0A445DDK5_ARAHY|nr:hypothetical protein Ahy_A04g018365 [Arachis hypogaea]